MNKRFGIGVRRSSFVVATILLSSLVAAHPETPAQAVGAPSWWSSTNFVKATEISVGDQPSDLVVSPDGDFLYVTNRGSDSVSKIEALTGAVVDTIPLAPATGPVAIAINPSGTQVYVASTGGVGWLSVIDVSAIPGTVQSSFATAGIPSDVAISPDGSKAYITLPANNDVAYVNTSPTPAAITGLITETAASFNAPTSVAFSPDSTMAYVANSGATNENVLSRINVSTSAVISNHATYTNNDNPELIAVSPEGEFGLMTVNQTGVLDRVDSFFVTADGTDGTNKNRSAPGWSRFTGLAFSGDGSKFYSVHNGSLLADDQLLSWFPAGMTPPPIGPGFAVTDPTGVATTPTTDSGYPIYVLHESTDKVTVFAQATPGLLTTTGASGSTVTIDLDTPEIGFDLADNSVVEVLFNGVAAADLTASTGNTWTVTAPAGTGTVPVVVKFALGGRLSGNSAPAGDFTYSAEAGGGNSSSQRFTVNFDPAGGTCGEHASPWTVTFRGTYVLPTGADCRRDGFALQGWTRDPALTAPENLLTSSISRSATLTAVWGELPVAPSDALVLSNFNCRLCTAALIVVPIVDSASSWLHVTMNGTDTPCTFTGEVLGLRWCWLDGLTNGSAYTAAVSWQNHYGVGPSINRSFTLR